MGLRTFEDLNWASLRLATFSSMTAMFVTTFDGVAEDYKQQLFCLARGQVRASRCLLRCATARALLPRLSHPSPLSVLETLLPQSRPHSIASPYSIAPPYSKSPVQVGYVLGDTGRSYVVGLGEDFPQQPHHRDSACTLAEDAQGLCDRCASLTCLCSHH